MQKDDEQIYIENLQVVKKINNLTNKDFLYPEKNFAELSETLAKNITNQPIQESDLETIEFTGSTSQELQEVIDENPGKLIDIQSAQIIADSTIQLKSNTTILGNNVRVVGMGCEYVFTAEDATNIELADCIVTGDASYGVYLIDSENLVIEGCAFYELASKGISIVNCSDFKVNNCDIYENQEGGIYIDGNTSDGLIEGNAVHSNYGTSNWMAGIVLTNVESPNLYDLYETFDADKRFPKKENLYEQTKCPHKIIIENNEVKDNNSSGIYSDGAYSCYVINNNIVGNDKEGICLDYGTVGFYLKENLISGNGQRARQTDDDLEADFVLSFGRMEDGAAKSKLPGISLDNTAYNILENNIVINNYGSGIKMVCTTIRCLIFENVVKDNNLGENDSFHFFGIELGSAEADAETTDLDFAPDFENIICRNVISGSHYSGVFIGGDCYVNDVFDNVIMEPEFFAIEAISSKFNSIINNQTTAQNRIEYKE